MTRRASIMHRYALLFLTLTAACSRAPAEPAPSGARVSAASAADGTHHGDAATAAASPSPEPTVGPNVPLLWEDPPDFTRSPPKTPARAAEYVVHRVGNDPEDGECVVMTFGAREGGAVDDNVRRWTEQFRPIAAPPRRTTVEINGMKATLVEIAGTFTGNMTPNRGGFAMPTNKAGWRMIGAILEAPSGLWFFKMTGPDATVLAGAREFEQMVRSARPR